MTPWAYDMDHMSLTPWGLKLKLPIFQEFEPHGITVVLSAKIDGVFTGPLGIRLKRLEGSHDGHHYQRAGVAAVRAVDLEQYQTERRVIHLVHGDLGPSRSLLNAEKAKEFPRVWLRILSSNLTLAAVDPKAEWNEGLRPFQVADGNLSAWHRRVLVLSDAEGYSGYFVIVATMIKTERSIALCLMSYAALSTLAIDAVIGQARVLEEGSYDNPFDTDVKTDGKLNERVIAAEITPEQCLDELVFALDIRSS